MSGLEAQPRRGCPHGPISVVPRPACSGATPPAVAPPPPLDGGPLAAAYGDTGQLQAALGGVPVAALRAPTAGALADWQAAHTAALGRVRAAGAAQQRRGQGRPGGLETLRGCGLGAGFFFRRCAPPGGLGAVGR